VPTPAPLREADGRVVRNRDGSWRRDDERQDNVLIEAVRIKAFGETVWDAFHDEKDREAPFENLFRCENQLEVKEE